MTWWIWIAGGLALMVLEARHAQWFLRHVLRPRGDDRRRARRGGVLAAAGRSGCCSRGRGRLSRAFRGRVRANASRRRRRACWTRLVGVLGSAQEPHRARRGRPRGSPWRLAGARVTMSADGIARSTLRRRAVEGLRSASVPSNLSRPKPESNQETTHGRRLFVIVLVAIIVLIIIARPPSSCRSRARSWSSGSAGTPGRSTPASTSWCRSSTSSATGTR